MKERLDIPLIKGVPDNDLEQGLLAYKKNQLLQIAEKQQIVIQKSGTKSKIIEQLKPIIIENAAHYFAQLVSKEAQVIAELTHGMLSNVSDETLINVGPAIEAGYLFAYVVTNKVTLVLPNELVSSIVSETSSTQGNGESQNTSLFLRQMKNTQKIYGTDHIQYLVSVWGNYFTQSLTVEEAIKLKETAQ